MGSASAERDVKHIITEWIACAGLLLVLPACASGIERGAPGQSDSPAAPASVGPRIFFTDVETGPVTGGPNNLGVPISIFGKGFGAARGSSRVTIGGVEVAGYLVWGSNNANNRTLDMIVVQPGPKIKSGPIVVTVDGKSSNSDHSFAANSGRVYYVAASGSDRNPCSQSAPCATILHTAATVMRPGDTVLLRAGDYNEGEIWIRAAQGGTRGQAKVVKNYPGESVRLTNSSRGFLLDADYITVSGISFLNGKSLDVTGWASRDQRGARFINNTFSGTIGYSAIDLHGHDHTLAGNVCEVTNSTVGTMGHCYYVSHGSNLKILYNVAAGAPGYGLHIYDERRSADDFQRIISNVLVEGNIFRGSTQRSGMLVAMSDGGGRGNVIQNVVIRNNIFTRNNHAGLVLAENCHNVLIYHNTFYQNGRLAIYIEDDATIDHIDVRNNLIYQAPNDVCKAECTVFREGQIQIGARAQNVVINNNGYHPGPPNVIGRKDSNAVTGPVSFANTAGLDFHLLPGSAAIDRGVRLDAVPLDYDGRPRPQGTGFDIGAFEYQSGTRDGR
jgi:hypothetical protein